MVIYKKNFRRYTTSRGQIAFKTKRPNGLQNLNCKHNFGRIRPVYSLGGNTYLEEKIFIFIICLKRNFLSTTKFWEVQKYFGVTAPERPTVSAGLGTVARKSSIRGLHVCAGGARHSENVF